MGDFRKKPRPEISECFILVDKDGNKHEVKCGRCGKKAVVKDGDDYYCNRDWEFRRDLT